MEHHIIPLPRTHFLKQILDSFIPLAITIGNIVLSNLFIQVIPLYNYNTSNKLIVFIAVGLLSYSVSQFFIGIYAEAIQSVFIIKQFHRNLLPHNDLYPLELNNYQI